VSIIFIFDVASSERSSRRTALSRHMQLRDFQIACVVANVPPLLCSDHTLSHKVAVHPPRVHVNNVTTRQLALVPPLPCRRSKLTRHSKT